MPGSRSNDQVSQMWLRWLLIALAFECLAFWAARSMALDLTASYLRLMLGGAVFLLPIVLLAGLTLKNRFRFGLSTLLGLITVTAIVFSIAVAPLARFRSERAGAQRFKLAGMQPRYTPEIHAYLDSQTQELWFWLREYAVDVEGTAPTARITKLEIEGQSDLRLLLDHFDELDRLEDLSFREATKIDTAGMSALHTQLANREPLRFLRFHGEVPGSTVAEPIKTDFIDMTGWSLSGSVADENRLRGLPSFQPSTLLLSQIVPKEIEFESIRRTKIGRILLHSNSMPKPLMEEFRSQLPGVSIEWTE